MQTFLPVPDFAASAALLDQRRLGKQRVETIQVLRALTVPGYGWRRHPAVRMWRGYEEALVRYGLEMCRTWVAGGRKDTCALTLVTDLGAARPPAEVRDQAALAGAGELPPWLGEE
ncbi:MSMEG_6728 family protein, partial [Streptomyces alkaliphilus]|nr:cytoplasmic protein [Streptomyces alkaliphilus]